MSPPAVAWVTFLELTRWRKLRQKRADRADTIPAARWVVDFRRTAGMRKRMVIHNVTSYAEASAREEARVLGMDLAAAVFGKRWKRNAPALLRHHLISGTLPAGVAEAAAAGSRELPDAVEAWITGASSQRDKAAARARQEKRAIDAPSVTPPGAPRPRARKSSRPTAAERDKRNAVARQLLTDNPAMLRRDVAAQSGVSERTVDRLRGEMGSEPRRLHLAAK